MKLAFGTRPHYIISLRGNEGISLHTGSGNQPNALGPATYDTVTNTMDDLFQRMNNAGAAKLWGVVLEKNKQSGGWWITVCQQDEEGGTDSSTLDVIASGTPVDVYQQLLPHLHMLRGVT